MTAATRTKTDNGQAAIFPLDSFRDAATHLRRPFTPEAVKFKVQATWPKENPTGGLIVAYIDARLVVERLNLIVPDRWHDEYQSIGSGLMWCHLTVDGITRKDVGEGTGKGLVSDALKRAAVKFGVGVSLYAIPKMRLELSRGELKRGTRDKLEMTPQGESNVRGIYRLWLDSHGSQAFGDPLDHGDVADPQGDPEADEPVAEPEVDLATEADVAKLTQAAKGLTVAKVKLAFGSCALAPPGPTATGPNQFFAGVPRVKVDLLAEALTGATR